MKFTTTTEISRKGSKIFEMYDEAIVLFNNKPVGAVLNYEIYKQLKESGYLEKIINSIDYSKKDYYKGLDSSLKEWSNNENDNLFA